ncbi:MAG: hypothetical protein ACP6IP_03745 [Candidatus Njordarchaeia archaeon]
MLSSFYRVGGRVELYNLLRLLSFERIFYKRPFPVSKSLVSAGLNGIREGRCLYIHSNSFMLGRQLLFDILREALFVGGFDFYYFAKVPVGFDFGDVSSGGSVVVENVGDLNRLHFDEDVLDFLAGCKIVATGMNLESRRVLDELGVCGSNTLEVEVSKPSLDVVVSYLRTHFKLDSPEAKSLLFVANNDVDVMVKLGVLRDRGVNVGGLRDLTGFGDIVREIIVSSLEDSEGFFNILGFVSGVGFYVFPRFLVDGYLKSLKVLEGVLFSDYFGEYVCFDPKIVDLLLARGGLESREIFP